jgi:hypothetical protein
MKKIIMIFVLGLSLATSARADKAPQTMTDGGGGALTFTTAGITYKGKDGSTSTIPADRLNQICGDPSKLAADEGLKEVCDDWAIYMREDDHSSIGDPPQTLPNDCSMAEVVLLQQKKGSDGYLLLEYQISALAAGHDAEGEGRKIQDLLRATSPNPTSALASVFQTFDIATDKYKCGAYIQGLYAPNKEEAQDARKVAISVYNRLGIVNDRMKGYVEQKFRGADDLVNNAKTLAELSKDRDDAFSDLVSSATLMSPVVVLLRPVPDNRPTRYD